MRKLRVSVFCVLAALGLSACSWSSGSGSENSGSTESGVMSSFRETFSIGKRVDLANGETTDTWCPPVDVMKGGSILRTGSSAQVSTQLTLRHFARECVLQADNNVRVKVGVMGFALLGPGGRAGTLRAPVHIVIKDGEKIIAQRMNSSTVTIPQGRAQGEFIMVEDNIIVPAAHANSFEIEVGLAAGRRRR